MSLCFVERGPLKDSSSSLRRTIDECSGSNERGPIDGIYYVKRETVSKHLMKAPSVTLYVPSFSMLMPEMTRKGFHLCDDIASL